MRRRWHKPDPRRKSREQEQPHVDNRLLTMEWERNGADEFEGIDRLLVGGVCVATVEGVRGNDPWGYDDKFKITAGGKIDTRETWEDARMACESIVGKQFNREAA